MTELKNAPFEHKIFMLSGIQQSLLKEFFVPIAKRKKVKLLIGGSPLSFVNAVDIAKIVIKAFSESYMLQIARHQALGLGFEWSDTKILIDQRFWTMPEVFSLSIFSRDKKHIFLMELHGKASG